MPTLCQTFRKEAGVAWNRMRTAAELRLALSEETLTECSLYNIALAHQGTDIVIELATKPAEGNHGADWEWWLVHGRQFRLVQYPLDYQRRNDDEFCRYYW